MENPEDYTSYRINVPEAFEKVFTHFYYAANHTATTIQKTFLPSYQTILVFSFGSDVSLHSQQATNLTADKCIILGPVKQPFTYTLPVGAEILVANFKADAFYRFFGLAMVSQSTNPDDLLSDNCFTNLWKTLKPIESPEEKVDYILDFC